MTGLRIGEAAAIVGVDTHVLRHWEDVSVLVPARSGTGQRIYDENAINRALVIRRCQRAGLSLAQIRALGPEEGESRRALVEDHRSRIAEVVQQLQATDRFLGHLLSCSHSVISECPECSGFAAAAGPLPGPGGVLSR
ncbi:DNA-binding transcriptional MerR regulator [Promicromonospora sp. AC04]|uniref:helix-turn-helix domain-containing protein n=1 Tax=Promicromonospora sp. AC04 TaxID=2135723 RepID=UPI000D4E34C2|nr:MerR family transcriptional regulator [Promicromonospora sp. AC04]PUB32067.1 DNA-binding transcriptional MerR regulator [Promicromonospora sp. AC04]